MPGTEDSDVPGRQTERDAVHFETVFPHSRLNVKTVIVRKRFHRPLEFSEAVGEKKKMLIAFSPFHFSPSPVPRAKTGSANLAVDELDNNAAGRV